MCFCFFFENLIEWRVYLTFRLFFCSFVEFLKQIKRMHVLFRYSFIVFLWLILSFNQIMNDFFIDFFFARFCSLHWFRRHREVSKKNIWLRCCRLFVFCTTLNKIHEIHYECDKMKKKMINLFIHYFDNEKWFYKFI